MVSFFFYGYDNEKRKHKEVSFHRIPLRNLNLYYQLSKRKDLTGEMFKKLIERLQRLKMIM